MFEFKKLSIREIDADQEEEEGEENNLEAANEVQDEDEEE